MQFTKYLPEFFLEFVAKTRMPFREKTVLNLISFSALLDEGGKEAFF